ncbi:Potassium voltage-gated channel sub H member 7 [Physocladia obscura]|uniref:Potassium voltage-gated channel sub H member 7 n=1 Tax=Physocladia obscura TaxID=109957 RepID=A0AAD5XFP8_9FUNG|nr:Potassium voltage-gated channel sub H member 7 [Physocladia obscura]
MQLIKNSFSFCLRPSDPLEQGFAIVAALVGAILYAILVGTISSFSFGLDSSGRRFKEKIDEVQEYMTYRKLSEPVKSKANIYSFPGVILPIAFTDIFVTKGKYFDEDAILSEMNESLKQRSG